MLSTMASIGLTAIGRQFVIHFSCAETVDHHGRIIYHPAIKNDSSAILRSGPRIPKSSNNLATARRTTREDISPLKAQKNTAHECANVRVREIVSFEHLFSAPALERERF